MNASTHSRGHRAQPVSSSRHLLALVCTAGVLCTLAVACKDDKGEPLVILHTNDMHDQMMGFGPEADYTPGQPHDDGTVGGIARLATRIQAARQEAGSKPVLLLDAGDFTVGTPLSMLNMTRAPQLTLLDRLGYDAVALGNHELDWGPEGLAQMLTAAKAGGADVPILCGNMTLSSADEGDDALEDLFDDGTLAGTRVVELDGGMRVGIFGVMGLSAAEGLHFADPVTFPTEFEPYAAAVQTLVDGLRNQEQVDVVIGLVHGGLYASRIGEAWDLANTVTGIDIIVGGHTHDRLEDAVRVGETLIVQTSSRGQHLGRLQVRVGKDGRSGVSLGKRALLPVTDDVQGDPQIQALVDSYIDEVDVLLADMTVSPDDPTPLSYRTVIAEVAFDLPHRIFSESEIGHLVTDAYRQVATDLSPDDPPVIAVEASGIIRGGLVSGSTGELWFADLFRVTPVGRGYDALMGTPLVTYYLTNKELRGTAELVATVANTAFDDYRDFFVEMSGLDIEYLDGGPMFGSVTRVALEGASEPLDPEDDTACHKVVSNLYLALLMSTAEEISFGAVKVMPWQQGCQDLVADWQQHLVDADPSVDGVQELKTWQALVRYVSGLDDADDNGVADIPSTYDGLQGRIVAVPQD